EAFDYAHPSLPHGARLIVSLNNTSTLPTPEPLRSKLIPVERVSYPSWTKTNLMDVDGRTAGFYGSTFGPVPYSFDRTSDWDTFIVERVP
ncbi:MAG: hypothetical protein KGL74_06305, partial [Elusimicrobia bacterium]|nr:hypothetical protein [Elusimicrobiota bacterium]